MAEVIRTAAADCRPWFGCAVVYLVSVNFAVEVEVPMSRVAK